MVPYGPEPLAARESMFAVKPVSSVFLKNHHIPDAVEIVEDVVSGE
jgi:hypothetical protein